MTKNIVRYRADLLMTDTLHMSNAEAGAFLLLLAFAARSDNGALPGEKNPDGTPNAARERLWRLVRLSPRAWAKAAPTVLRDWTEGPNGELYPPRHPNAPRTPAKA